jgi:hypothetical protein
MVLSTKGNYMNNLHVLKNTLSVVIDADKELESGMPLYQVKALFDGLVLADVIDFDLPYGELLQNVLDSKRKDIAAVNIIRARSSLEGTIEALEIKIKAFEDAEQEMDLLSIESTCITVTSNEKQNEVQLQLNDIPRKRGRPKSVNALSGAQRAKKARDKKKANKLVTVMSTLSGSASLLYNEMILEGHDLNSIIELASASLSAQTFTSD